MRYKIQPTCLFEIDNQRVTLQFTYFAESDEPAWSLKEHLADTLSSSSFIVNNRNDLIIDSSFGFNFKYKLKDAHNETHFCDYTGKIEDLFNHMKTVKIEELAS